MQPDLDRLNREIAELLTGLDAKQTQATPATQPERWSIQQIVEHLVLTYTTTVAVIQARVNKRTPTRAAPTIKQRLWQFLMLDLGRFPEGRKSPEAVYPSLPTMSQSGAELTQCVQTELVRLDALSIEAEALFGTRRSVSHMILGPLSLAQWRRFHLVHGRHHAKQIEAIRKQRSF